MTRFYRLSKYGPRLPRRHSYTRVTRSADASPGFEVINGPMVAVSRTVGSPEFSVGSGDFTPRAGYHHLLIVDVRAFKGHLMPGVAWSIIMPEDVEAVRSIAVADIHRWLRQYPECIGRDNQLSWESIEAWVLKNREMVESWLTDHSQIEAIEFIDTIGAA
jgi:hypothetical protein